MHALSLTTIFLACAGFVTADDTVTNARIKVQLFAAPGFLSEVSVDAYNNQCLSLDNNLYAQTLLSVWHMHVDLKSRIDGLVQSILVGGHDVATVLRRDDYWTCRFYEYAPVLHARETIANDMIAITTVKVTRTST